MPETAEQRQQWKFNPPDSMGVEHRLDRIEQHLEKIAAGGSQSQASLGAVAKVLPQILDVLKTQ